MKITAHRKCFANTEKSSTMDETDSGYAETLAASTFGERFLYARDRQRVLHTYQNDRDLAVALGLRSSSGITEYKGQPDAPDGARVLALARILDVDPGWLAFGEATRAPAPAGFEEWLRVHRRDRDAASAPATKLLPPVRSARADVMPEPGASPKRRRRGGA